MQENTGWEGAAATIDELFQAALRADKYSELDALIGQVCSLRRFAPWNAFLIAAQRPGALAVASPREWEREFRRKVIPRSALRMSAEGPGCVKTASERSRREFL